MYSLNCKGRLLCWNDPIVMGILNHTRRILFIPAAAYDRKKCY